MKVFNYIFIISVILFVACSKEQSPKYAILSDECPIEISFESQILPIFNNNCSTSECHDASAAQGGLILTNFSGIEANAEKCISAMKHEGGIAMPIDSPKLADSIIKQFDCWIKQGKLDN